MKPRTKLEKHAMALAGKLPPLTDAQRRYAISLFPKIGYYLKKGEVWCQCCGYIDRVSKPMLAVSLEMETHYCPNCGKSLNLALFGSAILPWHDGSTDIRCAA